MLSVRDHSTKRLVGYFASQARDGLGEEGIKIGVEVLCDSFTTQGHVGLAAVTAIVVTNAPSLLRVPSS